jgi:hypothetical protein
VRTGSAEKETELRGRLSLVPDGGPREIEGRRHLHLAPPAGDQTSHETDQQTDQHDTSTGRDDN